jgi:hypothetical protein
MQPLSPSQMLAVWERGLERIPLERALILLEAACPDCDRASLAVMSIGQRDARLLRLREWAFGSEIAACTACPQCHQYLEFTFQADALRQGGCHTNAGQIPCSIDGYELLLRPLNSLDLMSCAGLDATALQHRLLGCCFLSARLGDTAISLDRVPEEVIAPALESAASADSATELYIEASCANCCHSFHEVFDILSFFWSEIDAWVRRMLREVHVLASAYGWTESDILALSPLRRQLYLELANA